MPSAALPLDYYRATCLVLSDRQPKSMDALLFHAKSDGDEEELIPFVAASAREFGASIAVNGSSGEEYGRDVPGAAWPGADVYIDKLNSAGAPRDMIVRSHPAFNAREENSAFLVLAQEHDWERAAIITLRTKCFARSSAWCERWRWLLIPSTSTRLLRGERIGGAACRDPRGHASMNDSCMWQQNLSALSVTRKRATSPRSRNFTRIFAGAIWSDECRLPSKAALGSFSCTTDDSNKSVNSAHVAEEIVAALVLVRHGLAR